jgi:hypothetical protein
MVQVKQNSSARVQECKSKRTKVKVKIVIERFERLNKLERLRLPDRFFSILNNK